MGCNSLDIVIEVTLCIGAISMLTISLNVTWDSQNKNIISIDESQLEQLHSSFINPQVTEIQLVITCLNPAIGIAKIKIYTVKKLGEEFVCYRTSNIRKLVKFFFGWGGDMSLALTNKLNTTFKEYQATNRDLQAQREAQQIKTNMEEQRVINSNSRPYKRAIFQRLQIAYDDGLNDIEKGTLRKFTDDFDQPVTLCLSRLSALLSESAREKRDYEGFWTELCTFLEKRRKHDANCTLPESMDVHFNTISDNIGIDSEESAKIICDSLLKLVLDSKIEVNWPQNYTEKEHIIKLEG